MALYFYTLVLLHISAIATLTSTSEGTRSLVKSTHIVNGRPASAYLARHLARLKIVRTNSRASCSGTILSATTILTAAHCLHPSPKSVTVRLGAFGRPAVPVRLALIHRNYSSSAPIAFDVGVVVLATRLPRSAFRRARLPASTWKAPRHGFSIRAAGFGSYRSGSPSVQRPRVASLVVSSSSLCAFVSRFTFASSPEGVLCAVAPQFPNKAGGAVCDGDSGGPLFADGPVVRGVVVKRAWVGANGNTGSSCGGKGSVVVASDVTGVVRSVKRVMLGKFDDWKVHKLQK